MKKIVYTTIILTIIMISIISQSIATNFKIHKINLEKDIYKIIPTNDFILHEIKVIPNRKLVIFYQDKSEANLNKNFALVFNYENKKVLKNLALPITRYKQSVVDKSGNIYILSWKPVDLYFLDTQNLSISKAYDNTFIENQPKYLFNLDSRLLKSFNGEVLVTMDLRKQKEYIDDVVICKIEYVNNELKIIPYFSSISISEYFGNEPHYMIINYPLNIFVNKINSNRVYDIKTSQEYTEKVDIQSICKEFNFICKRLFDASNRYLLVSLYEENKHKLTLVDYTKQEQKVYINNEKFIEARFLSDKQVIFCAFENKKINYYLFTIDGAKIEKIPLENVKNTVIEIIDKRTFLSFDKQNIYIVSLE
ncbi:MAG: hypothetical protein ABDH21_02155 [bacterium]